jgi:hypothetical protein
MLAGAYIAGMLTIGAGGRLMMRILAATSSDDVQGLRTEADETIGEVTVGGSFFLIVVAGIGAALAGLALFSILRRRLPDRSIVAGLVGVAIGGGLLVRPAGLIAANNSDFKVLAPVALAVALSLSTLVLFGATFGVLVDHLGSRWPRPGWSPRGVVAVLPFAVLLPVPPIFVAALLVILVGSLATKSRSAPAPAQGDAVQGKVEGAATRAARLLVMALGGLGGLSIVVAAGEVLAL